MIKLEQPDNKVVYFNMDHVVMVRPQANAELNEWWFAVFDSTGTYYRSKNYAFAAERDEAMQPFITYGVSKVMVEE